MTENWTRRTLITSATAMLASSAIPAWARGVSIGGGHHGGHGRGGDARIPAGFDQLSGDVINLSIGDGHRVVDGRRGGAIAVNGSVPGPLIRLREGQDVTINVTNGLRVDSSIHWHGILLPFQMDGVPGISFPGIAPGATFAYQFRVRQAGTYWYHSHSGLQEQSGHYGPIIIDPAAPDAVGADRDYVLVLSEFTPLDPHFIMDRLRTGEAYFNHQQNTMTDDYPMSTAERRMWAEMRMMPTDIADVSAPTYTYLINGRSAREGMEFAFAPGERVRLRIINASAMSFFNFRIPGLALQIIAADGQNVQPVMVDELQIGTAETYDVIVTPGSAGTYAIVAESMDRSGMAVAMLAAQPGARAAVPPLRPPPLLTMADMGMNHGAMGHGDGGHEGMPAMGHGAHNGGVMAGTPQQDSMAMGGMNMRDRRLLPPDVNFGPGVDMVSMAPVDKMGDPGIGLRDVPHRVLNYQMLVAATPNADTRVPSRLLELHLTGNMERYMWSFDGRMFSAVSDVPVRFAWNERVRVKLVNDTMMAHPIHLHGMFFTLVNGQDAARQPRKHTLIVQPGASAQFDLSANEPGDWAFHCHLLYHMHGGMMQVVTVMGPGA
ncbi:MAG: copper resistance system multicopper oxidase [Sphingomonadaceae bacterium]|nr:copper resistance system multicopper oxidase [Sphingomonadaceae bacterium]